MFCTPSAIVGTVTDGWMKGGVLRQQREDMAKLKVITGSLKWKCVSVRGVCVSVGTWEYVCTGECEHVYTRWCVRMRVQWQCGNV